MNASMRGTAEMLVLPLICDVACVRVLIISPNFTELENVLETQERQQHPPRIAFSTENTKNNECGTNGKGKTRYTVTEFHILKRTHQRLLECELWDASHDL